MLTSIYFLFSFLLCFILLFTLKKIDKPLSFTNSIIVNYIMLWCFVAVLVLPPALLSIPINLITVSVIYNIISIVLFILHRKNKERQTYYLNKFDAASFVIMMLFILFIVYRVFTFELKLAYFSTDIANHFDFASSIIRTGKLKTMYFASLNNAIFIQFLSPLFPGINAYKSMIIAETVSNFLSGMIFYVLISYKKRSKLFSYISPAFMLLYFCGWPLYQYILGGFVYWGIGATLVLFGLYLFYLYQDYPDLRKKLFAMLPMVIYCIAVCYVLFVPFVLVLYLFCFIKISLKSSTMIKPSKQLIKIVLALGVLGTIILVGVLYLYFGDFNIFSTFLARDGGIHKEIYRDYIYFIPFLCYLGTKYRQNKEFDLNFSCFKIYTVLVFASLGLCLVNILSPYYYYKFYFILWALVWLVTCDAVDKLLEESRSWIYAYTGFILFLLVSTFTPLEHIFVEKGMQLGFVVEFPLYSAVGSYLKDPGKTMFDDEDYWEVMRYLEDHSLQLPLITDDDYYYWYHTFFNVKHYTSDILDEDFAETFDGFVLHKNITGFTSHKNTLDRTYDILFENTFGVVYQKR